MVDNTEDVTATEREPTYVALRGSDGSPDLAASGRPVVGVCSTHDQGCCAGCPTLGCRFCRCRRDGEACSHVSVDRGAGASTRKGEGADASDGRNAR